MKGPEEWRQRQRQVFGFVAALQGSIVRFGNPFLLKEMVSNELQGIKYLSQFYGPLSMSLLQLILVNNMYEISKLWDLDHKLTLVL